MKELINIIILLTFGLFFSCSNDYNAISNNNGMEYEFTITINGQVHKVKGNSTNGIPLGGVFTGTGVVQNTCVSSLNPIFGAGVQLGINDVTAPNYISGQNMQIMIILPNPLLGTNQATLSFSGNYFDTLATSLGAYIYTGFNSYSSTLVAVNGGLKNTIIPILITDLGTTTTLVNNGSAYSFGQTIKGNYSGTIYLERIVAGEGIFYDIPVQLSINFKALRMN